MSLSATSTVLLKLSRHGDNHLPGQPVPLTTVSEKNFFPNIQLNLSWCKVITSCPSYLLGKTGWLPTYYKVFCSTHGSFCDWTVATLSLFIRMTSAAFSIYLALFPSSYPPTLCYLSLFFHLDFPLFFQLSSDTSSSFLGLHGSSFILSDLFCFLYMLFLGLSPSSPFCLTLLHQDAGNEFNSHFCPSFSVWLWTVAWA